MIELDGKYNNWEDREMPDMGRSQEHLDWVANNLGKYYYSDVYDERTTSEVVRESLGDDLLLEKLNKDQREYLFQRVQYHADFWEYDFVKECVHVCLDKDLNKQTVIETYNLDEETFLELHEYFS